MDGLAIVREGVLVTGLDPSDEVPYVVKVLAMFPQGHNWILDLTHVFL
jgi:hypothetical protein